jgi:hypothetical protein
MQCPRARCCHVISVQHAYKVILATLSCNPGCTESVTHHHLPSRLRSIEGIHCAVYWHSAFLRGARGPSHLAKCAASDGGWSWRSAGGADRRVHDGARPPAPPHRRLGRRNDGLHAAAEALDGRQERRRGGRHRRGAHCWRAGRARGAPPGGLWMPRPAMSNLCGCICWSQAGCMADACGRMCLGNTWGPCGVREPPLATRERLRSAWCCRTGGQA